MKFIFQGISHAQYLQLEALFYIHDHHNIWMEECLLHLYLVRVPRQAHPRLSQAVAVVPSHFINLTNQFSCKRILESSQSLHRVPTSAAPPIIVQITIYFEGWTQDLKFSGSCCLVKMILLVNSSEDLIMGNRTMGSQCWLIVWVSSYWGIIRSWVHHWTSVLALLYQTGRTESNFIYRSVALRASFWHCLCLRGLED